MREATLTKNVIRALRARGVYCVKIHGSQYQEAGLPDLWCVVSGRLVCLEVKTAKGKATKIQQTQLVRLRKAGATAEVVRSVEEAIVIIENARGDR